MFLVQLVVFCEDTVHDLRDIVLIWFEEYDQILHGAVSGADIYGADTLMDRMLHAFHGFLNIFNIGHLFRRSFHRYHDKITRILMAASQPVDVFVCKT